MSRFVSTTLGKHYVTAMPFNLERSFEVGTVPPPLHVHIPVGAIQDAAGLMHGAWRGCTIGYCRRQRAVERGLGVQDARPGTPIFVFLSPGVDVAAAVEALGQKKGFTAENGRQAPDASWCHVASAPARACPGPL